MLEGKTILKLGLVCLLVFLPAFAQESTVTVGHGIPGSDVDPSFDPALPVDVLVNGTTCLLTEFTFGEFAGPVELPAGDYVVEIKVANPADPCSNPTAIGPATVPLAAGESATVIAHLAEDGSLTASKFIDDLSGLGPGLGRLIVHHTAAAPAVDIKLRRGLREVVVPTLANGDQAGTEIRPGGYELSIGPAGQALVVFGPTSVRFKPFQVTRVYAVGSLQNGSFTLMRKDELVSPSFLDDRPGRFSSTARSSVDSWRGRGD